MPGLVLWVQYQQGERAPRERGCLALQQGSALSGKQQAHLHKRDKRGRWEGAVVSRGVRSAA